MAADVQHQVADAARPQAQRDDEPDDAPAARRAYRTELRADDGVGLRLGLVDVPPHAVVVDVVDREDGDVGRDEKERGIFTDARFVGILPCFARVSSATPTQQRA